MIKLRELRESREITQLELANALNISPSTIGMYEQGRRSPDPETLSMLADYFKVSIDHLLGRDETDTHYYDPEVAEMINAAHKDPDLRVLFNASKKLTKEELQAVLSMIKVMSKEG